MKSRDVTSHVPIVQEDTGTCMTPRNSLDDEKCFFQTEKDVSETVEKDLGNVSLVDESYGNEDESDTSVSNNVNDQVNKRESSEDTIPHSGDQLTGFDESTKHASLEDQEAHLPSVVESERILEKHLENGQENDDAFSVLPSNQTIQNSIEETASNATEQIGITSRNLRRSTLSAESEIQRKNISRRSSSILSYSEVKSPRINLKKNGKRVVDKRKVLFSAGKARHLKNEITAKRRGRKPKHLSENDRSLLRGSRVNRNGMKTVSEKGKRGIKIKMTQPKRISKDVKTKLAKVKMQKKGKSSKNQFGEAMVVNKMKSKENVDTKESAVFKETNGQTVNASETKSTVPPGLEKPLDRYIKLDFLLTVNQVMSDLVSDGNREEAALDQVKETERKDVMNLAKLYRLRVRMAGRCEGEFPVVLVKGRESCLPKPGEVDGLLSTMSDTLANKTPAGLPRRSGNKHKIDEEMNTSVNENLGRKSNKRRA